MQAVTSTNVNFKCLSSHQDTGVTLNKTSEVHSFLCNSGWRHIYVLWKSIQHVLRILYKTLSISDSDWHWWWCWHLFWHCSDSDTDSNADSDSDADCGTDADTGDGTVMSTHIVGTRSDNESSASWTVNWALKAWCLTLNSNSPHLQLLASVLSPIILPV